MTRIATLKDIAQEAHVSITTISNVVNGNYSKVSPANVERIRALIQKHNYVPNQTARSLSSHSSHIIAIVIQANDIGNALGDAYTGQFVGAVTLQLQKFGYDAMIRITNDYQDINHTLRRWNTEGAIFTGTYDKNIRGMSEDTEIPFVFTDSYSSSRRINNVGVDDFRGGMLAAEYLLGLGHKKIAFIAPGLYKSEVDEQRRSGFISAMGRRGLRINDAWFIDASDDEQDTARQLVSLADPVTAVFVTADRTALRLISGLKELGRSVPEDYSVVGFDDIELGRHLRPSLSTIAQDINQKAKIAVEILLRHIQNPQTPVENILLAVSLIERESARAL